MAEKVHVFFDLDHTLWDFEANSREALRELFSEYQLEVMGISDAWRFIDAYERENEQCWELYRKGAMSKEVLRHERFMRALARFGVADQQLAITLGKEYISRSPRKTQLVEGSIEALEHLKAANYVLHILTNGFDEVQHIKVDKSGLKPYFDQVITSDQLGVKKPHPDAFHKSKALAGIVHSEIYMIGDHLEADVLGAINAGWKGIYYNPNQQSHSEVIDHEVAHLLDLKNIL